MYESQVGPRPEHGLPAYTTEIIGRAQEIEEISGLLGQSRLVTIVGTGGIGKTRIATEIARGDSHTPVFVNLEPLRDPHLVVSTIAASVGCELQGTTDPETALVNVLAEQKLLLVLDNCEHVLRRVSSLCHLLLASCPRIRILATSREALGIETESIYRLQALDDKASVRLFIERGRSKGAMFAGSPDDLAVISEICRRLDGIPLAIELAGACVEDRTPKALLARLRERFRLLERAASHTVTAHHRTLRAMIDWSYDLLSPDEQGIFLRLSVFCGDFSREAANAAVGVNVNLEHFTRKSLLAPSPDVAGRFRMLESMREYAMLHLPPGETEHIARAHATYFADLARQAASEFGELSEELWLSRYVPDLDNFRAALTWMYGNDKTLAATTLGNLKEFWFHANLSYEGLNRSQALVAALRLDDDRALNPLLAISTLAWRAGEFKVSHDAAKRALEIAERVKDARAIAQARFGLGWALFKLGDTESALAALSLAVKDYRELDEPLRTLLAEIDYAIALKHSDPSAGRALLEQTLEPARASGWSRAAMRVENGLAEYAFLDGDTDRAIQMGRAAIATARSGSSIYALAVALLNTSAYLSIAGRHEEAQSMASESASLSRSHGFRIVTEWALQSAAIGIAFRDARTAALILGHVDAFADEVGAQREPTEMAVRRRLRDVIESGLQPGAIEELVRQGRMLSMVDACALAFSGVDV